MRISETELKGVKILEPALFRDSRGYFLEIFNDRKYHEAGLHRNFAQDNFSTSRKGSLRGLHLQNPNQQGKLVMVVRAASQEEAAGLFEHHPHFTIFPGQSVEVMPVLPIPEG